MTSAPMKIPQPISCPLMVGMLVLLSGGSDSWLIGVGVGVFQEQAFLLLLAVVRAMSPVHRAHDPASSSEDGEGPHSLLVWLQWDDVAFKVELGPIAGGAEPICCSDAEQGSTSVRNNTCPMPISVITPMVVLDLSDKLCLLPGGHKSVCRPIGYRMLQGGDVGSFW